MTIPQDSNTGDSATLNLTSTNVQAPYKSLIVAQFPTTVVNVAYTFNICAQYTQSGNATDTTLQGLVYIAQN